MAQKVKTVTRLTMPRDDAEVLAYVHDVALAEVKRRYPGTPPGAALVRRVGAGLAYYFNSLDLSLTIQAQIAPDAAQIVSTPEALPSDPYLQSAEAEQADVDTIPA